MDIQAFVDSLPDNTFLALMAAMEQRKKAASDNQGPSLNMRYVVNTLLKVSTKENHQWSLIITIKMVRALTKWSLKESKDYVDKCDMIKELVEEDIKREPTLYLVLHNENGISL
jgi:ribosomal protein L7/L12